MNLMRRFLRPLFSIAVASLALPLAILADTATARAQAQELQRTRFVIGIPNKSTFQVFSLAKPNRVVVELPTVDLRLPNQPKNGPVGLVKAFHAGIAGPKRTRVVIEMTAPVIVQKAAVETQGNAHHLVLDIVPVVQTASKPTPSRTFDKPFSLGAAGLQPPLPRLAATPQERAARTARRTIVIDPGHGGEDTGAKKNGTVEKNVVLAFSHALRKQLEATGRYNVLMTRSTDKFITLDGRRAFAEKHNAHLFIAVHADYARSKARGATVYSLRSSVAKSLRRSAKKRAGRIKISGKKFAASPATGSDRKAVKGFLADLARRDLDITIKRSDEVSRSIISFMGGSTNLRNDPHKTAAFRVLKTAQFPSVLIELAYVTNKKDARLLKSESWRKKVATSLTTAVDDYFGSQIANLPM